MTTMTRVLSAVLFLSMALTACKREVLEVEDGNYLTYQVGAHRAVTKAKIRIVLIGDERWLYFAEGPSRQRERVEVNDQLMPKDGSLVESFYLDRLWLPPSKRKVGARFSDGGVVDIDTRGSRPAAQFNIVKPNVGGRRYYDIESGIQMRFSVNLAGNRIDGNLTEAMLPEFVWPQ